MPNSTKSNDNESPSVVGDVAGAAPFPSAAAASSSPGPSPYSLLETVLASHKGRFYEAKVNKIELRGKEWTYFIHYRGWKKKWDEWVGVDRMLKGTYENLLKKSTPDKKYYTEKYVKAGMITQSVEEKLVGEGSSSKNQLPDSTIPKKKRNRPKVDDSTPMEKSATIFIPLALKKQLMDDFEFIREGKLVKLPRSPNVDEILIKYQEYRKQKDGVTSESVEEILRGLRAYFDKALPVLLLYNKERQQYEQATTDNISPSKLYGAEHLLRLFVKLPALLHNLNIEEDTLSQLQQKLQELLQYLRKNHENFFLSSYHLPEHSVTPLERNGT